MFVYFATQASFVGLYVAGVNEFVLVNYELSIFIISVVGIVFLYMLYIHVKSSGKPYKSDFHWHRLWKLHIVISVWNILKLARGIGGLYTGDLISSISNIKDKETIWVYLL